MDFNSIYGVGLSFSSNHDVYRRFRFNSFQATGSYSIRGVLPGGAAEPATGGVPDAGGVEATNWEALGGDSGLSNRENEVGSSPVSTQGLNWNAGFSFSYGGSRPFADAGMQTSARLNGHLEAQITKNWSMTYSNAWNITDGTVAGETVTLRRDLHCWEASFTRSRLGDETTFYFRINVKALRDIKYEQGVNGGSGLNSITNYLP